MVDLLYLGHIDGRYIYISSYCFQAEMAIVIRLKNNQNVYTYKDLYYLFHTNFKPTHIIIIQIVLQSISIHGMKKV
jgi:hypothetical protein